MILDIIQKVINQVAEVISDKEVDAEAIIASSNVKRVIYKVKLLTMVQNNSLWEMAMG